MCMEKDISGMGVVLQELFLPQNVGCSKSYVLKEQQKVHHSQSCQDGVCGVDHLLSSQDNHIQDIGEGTYDAYEQSNVSVNLL